MDHGESVKIHEFTLEKVMLPDVELYHAAVEGGFVCLGIHHTNGKCFCGLEYYLDIFGVWVSEELYKCRHFVYSGNILFYVEICLPACVLCFAQVPLMCGGVDVNIYFEILACECLKEVSHVGVALWFPQVCYGLFDFVCELHMVVVFDGRIDDPLPRLCNRGV